MAQNCITRLLFVTARNTRGQTFLTAKLAATMKTLKLVKINSSNRSCSSKSLSCLAKNNLVANLHMFAFGCLDVGLGLQSHSRPLLTRRFSPSRWQLFGLPTPRMPSISIMSHRNKSKPSYHHLIVLSLSIATWTHCLAQANTPQLSIEMIRPIRFQIIRYRPEPSSSEISKQQQQTLPDTWEPQKQARMISKESPFRLTINDSNSKHVIKLEHVINTLDRLAYAISKPAVIFNVVKLFSMLISSLFMSIFVVPYADHSTMQARRHRGKHIWKNLVDQLNRSDIEGIIELIGKNFDESVEKFGFVDKILCRDKIKRNTYTRNAHNN